MPRKIVSGPLRDKSRTKDKLLKSVGKIIATEGFQGLKITKIAQTAGVDKKLIYNYFGAVDELIKEYLHSADFASQVNNLNFPETGVPDHGKQLSKLLVRRLQKAVSESRELQKIIVWEMYEYNDMLRELCDLREKLGQEVFQAVMHPHFKDHHKQYRAVLGILISSTYFLNIHAAANGSTFCGLDINNTDDQQVICNVMDDFIDFAYDQYGLGQ